MFVVLDKESTKVYGFNCYLTSAKVHGVSYVLFGARHFRTEENAIKFARKWFKSTNDSEYEIIKD